MTDEKNAKTAEMFICDICDFQCYKKSNYISHNLTAKHFNSYILLITSSLDIS